MKRIFTSLISLCLLFGMYGQEYIDHTAISSGNDFKASCMGVDDEGNMYVAGNATASLLLQKDNASESDGSLRLMSYNIKGGDILSSRTLKRITTVINDYAPDVVAVQEVSNYWFDSGATLGSQTGMYSQFLATHKGYFGNVLLSKEKPLSVQTQLIERSEASTDPDTHRGVIIAEFANYFYLATHFSLYGEDRTRMIEYIVNFARNAGKSVILAGDLNISSTSENMKQLLNGGFRILNDPNVFTFPSTGATACIDYVLGYNDAMSLLYDVKESGIANQTTSDLTTASDHLPIYVDLNLYKRTASDHLLQMKNENRGIYIVKYDAFQTPQWYRMIQGTGDICLTDFRIDKMGGIYVAGTCRDFSADASSGTNLAGTGSFFLQLQGNGNFINTRFYPTSFANTRFATVLPLTNGDYLVGGDTENKADIEGAPLGLNGNGSVVALYSQDGNLKWIRTINPQIGAESCIHKLVTDSQGNFYVAFTSNTTDIQIFGETLPTDSHTAYSMYLSQFDISGNVLQTIKFKGLGGRSDATQRDLCQGEGAMPVAITIDSNQQPNLVLWGSGKRIEIVDGQGSLKQVINDFSTSTSLDYGGVGLLRMSKDGEFQSFHSLGVYEELRDANKLFKIAPSICADFNGNVYVGSSATSDQFAYLSDYAPLSRGGSDFLIARVNQKNELDFVRRVGGTGDDALPVLSVYPAMNRLILGIQTTSSPTYLGLNAANGIDQQQQMIKIPQNYGNLLLARYNWANMTTLESPTGAAALVVREQGGILVRNIEGGCKVGIYSLSGRLLKEVLLNSGSGMIPFDFGTHRMVIVKLVNEKEFITYKLFN